jgi:hypothetical protein
MPAAQNLSSHCLKAFEAASAASASAGKSTLLPDLGLKVQVDAA